ncbi:MAG: hypothetical protein IH987_21980 [Planctomycetes bacterium]|nr:hypothetical protein [Planctomycetota bacterium]
MKRIYTTVALVIIFAAIVGGPYVLWVLFKSVFLWLSAQESQVGAAIIAAAATVLAAVGAVTLSQQRTKAREVSESHRPQKIDLYSRFIKKVMEVMYKYDKDKSENAMIKDTELEKFFQDFTTDLVLWGSPGVVRAYANFRRANKNGGSLNNIVVMDDVIRAMRKDLGHGKQAGSGRRPIGRS